jgi:hypothetical protein
VGAGPAERLRVVVAITVGRAHRNVEAVGERELERERDQAVHATTTHGPACPRSGLRQVTA